jgi:hypothetical protein
MTDLKVKRSVAKCGTSFHTFPAPDTKLLIDGIFEKWLFYEAPFDGGGGA